MFKVVLCVCVCVYVLFVKSCKINILTNSDILYQLNIEEKKKKKNDWLKREKNKLYIVHYKTYYFESYHVVLHSRWHYFDFIHFFLKNVMYIASGVYSRGVQTSPFWSELFVVVVLFAYLLVREVGDVQGYPYPVDGELTKKKLWKKGCHPPPPPPFPPATFFRTGAASQHHSLHAMLKHPPWKYPVYATILPHPSAKISFLIQQTQMNSYPHPSPFEY